MDFLHLFANKILISIKPSDRPILCSIASRLSQSKYLVLSCFIYLFRLHLSQSGL